MVETTTIFIGTSTKCGSMNVINNMNELGDWDEPEISEWKFWGIIGLVTLALVAIVGELIGVTSWFVEWLGGVIFNL